MAGVSGWVAFAAVAHDFGSLLTDGGGFCCPGIKPDKQGRFAGTGPGFALIAVAGQKNGGLLPPVGIRMKTI